MYANLFDTKGDRMLKPEATEKDPEKKRRAKSNAQKKYDLFRSIGNAVRRIREENEKKAQILTPDIINYYVLEHLTPTRVKLAKAYSMNRPFRSCWSCAKKSGQEMHSEQWYGYNSIQRSERAEQ